MFDTKALRSRLAKISKEYTSGELGVGVGAFAEPESKSWFEYAHTPHLLHLGTARVLRAASEAARLAGGVLIFCVNDHLPARELAESRRLPLVLQGLSTAAGPDLGLSGALTKMGMDMVASPDADHIDAFCKRWCQLDRSNSSRIERICADLTSAAAKATSYAAFLTRVMLQTTGTHALCLPSSVLAANFPHEIETLGLNGHLWLHCKSCGYRLGRVAAQDVCRVCGGVETRSMLDVVGRQVLMNAAHLSLRFCGSPKPYQEEADTFSTRVGTIAPPRMHVTGKVVVIGSNKRSFGRVNLLELMSYGHTVDKLETASSNLDVTLRLDAPQ